MTPRGTAGPPRYACWLFDLDGVLVDTTPCHARAFDALWDSIGVAGPAYDDIAGRRTLEVIRDYAGHLATSDEQLEEWVRFKQQHARECLATVPLAFPDSAACLEAVHRAGRTIALGTGASRATTMAILDRLGWTHYFSVIVTADDVTRGKPSPDVHTLAIERSRMLPTHTLIIEDSRSGLDAAVATGADVVSVHTGLVAEGPNFRDAFADLRAVLAAFEGTHA